MSERIRAVDLAVHMDMGRFFLSAFLISETVEFEC